jgi:putative ABC transport system permease protein
MMVMFNEPRAPTAAFDVAHLPGVRQVEPFRALAVRVRVGHRARRVELLGLEPTGNLRWIVDAGARRVPLPATGLLVNTKLAEILGARVGDEAEVTVLEGERQVVRLEISGIVSEPLGLGVYVDRHVLARALREDALVSGALLRVDRADRERLSARLKTVPLVAGVSMREGALQTFRDLLARSFLALAFVNLIFAGTITFGMVYNGARIALSERGYELATLRVLGFTRAEATRLLLGEQALLLLGGIPVGFALGAAASLYFSYLLTTELYRIPFVLTASMIAQAFAVLLGAAAVSGAFVAWLLHRFDLVAVLKARE